MPINLNLSKNALGNNDMPVLRFDGTGDYLEFDEISTIRTVFLVLNRARQIKGFILGHPTQHAFHSEASYRLESGMDRSFLFPMVN